MRREGLVLAVGSRGLVGLSGVPVGAVLGLPRVRLRRGCIAGVGSSWLGAGIGAGLIGAVVVGVGVGRGRHEPIVVTHP